LKYAGRFFKEQALGSIAKVAAILFSSPRRKGLPLPEKKGSELMTYLENSPGLQPQDIEYFKDLLSRQLDELLARAERTVAELIRNGDISPDIIDQASLDIGRNYTLRICDRESRLIRKIKTALTKIEEGTFGICESCEEEICVERLKARPVTAYCIRCKTQMEAFEKVSGI
jgi:DnaK suppressor protein